MQKQITAPTSRLRHTYARLLHLLKQIDSALPKIDLSPPDLAATDTRQTNERRLFIGGRTVVIRTAAPEPANLPTKATANRKHAA